MTRAYPLLLIGLIALPALNSPAVGNVELVRVKTTADSEAPGYESYKAMDGNPRTMWHTPWGAGETRHPHEIVVNPVFLAGVKDRARDVSCPPAVAVSAAAGRPTR